MGLMAEICNPGTGKVESGRSEVQGKPQATHWVGGHPRLLEILSQKKRDVLNW